MQDYNLEGYRRLATALILDTIKQSKSKNIDERIAAREWCDTENCDIMCTLVGITPEELISKLE